jgi:hypothetical protein
MQDNNSNQSQLTTADKHRLTDTRRREEEEKKKGSNNHTHNQENRIDGASVTAVITTQGSRSVI